MKINWFSPLPPANTDIAHFTARILPEFQKRSEVVLWTAQDHWDPALDLVAQVRKFSAHNISWPEVNRAEVSFFNIGNNHLFHQEIWEVSRRHPGIVVLHDLCLQDFFGWAIYKQTYRDQDGYCQKMETYYGEAGRRAAVEFWEGQYPIHRLAEKFPLTPLALENALGAIVHTRNGFEELRRQGRLPVACIPLPYQAKDYEENGCGKDGPPYRLIVFGYIGTNRRLESVLQALAELPDREKFRLDIYGEVWDERHVRNRIGYWEIGHLVKMHGFVPEEELDGALAAAHLAINLRYPTMGEASGSQLRIWDHSLPSVVTSVGWYESLPSSTVAFVRPDSEIDDLKKILWDFLRFPSRFAEMGKEGRRVLEMDHTPEGYTQSLINFHSLLRTFSSTATLTKHIQRIVNELNYLPDLNDDYLKHISRNIFSII